MSTNEPAVQAPSDCTDLVLPARRTVLTGLLGVAASVGGLALGPDLAIAQGASKAKAAAPAAHAAIVAAARRCGRVGEVCLKHCIRLTKAGDTSLAGCMATVRAMLPVCAALVQLAGQNAARLKDFAKVCSDICADCEAECRKHAGHHVECKNCADACAALIKELKAISA